MSTICTARDTIARPSGPSVRTASGQRDWQQATSLLQDYVAWIEASSGISVFVAQPDFADELRDLARAYSGTTAALFVAEDTAGICGTLAVRIDASGAAEFKRMYVRPTSRGRGHASRLLGAALAWAERHGARRAWLETLPGVMDPAIQLYRRAGFRPAAMRAHVDVEMAIVMSVDLPARATA